MRRYIIEKTRIVTIKETYDIEAPSAAYAMIVVREHRPIDTEERVIFDDARTVSEEFLDAPTA